MMRALFLLLLSCSSTDSLHVQPRGCNNIRHSSTSLNSIPNAFDTLTSGLASICRLPRGVTAESSGSRTASPDILTIYDIENDVNCRLVRERLTELDLNFRVVPSAPNSKVFTDASYKYALSSGTSLPTLSVGGGKMLTGSQKIVDFLDNTYGNGAVEKANAEDQDIKEKALAFFYSAGNNLASLLRTGRGCMVSSAAGDKTTEIEPLIILYSYEGNQFCRLVREVLTELDLVYEVRSAGKTSPRREELSKITGGSTQCPYLIDPNTAESMSESADVIQYLYKMYGKYTPPNELLQFASDTVLPVLKPLFGFLAKLQAGSMQDDSDYQVSVDKAEEEIVAETKSEPLMVYTYELSPFSWETKALFDRLNVSYKEISLGKEWFPGFIAEGGAAKRAALLEITGQSSLPHIFVGGKWIGGLFDGEPGLVPSLNDGSFWKLLDQAKAVQDSDMIGAFE
jgi:glutathione S-transferase